MARGKYMIALSGLKELLDNLVNCANLTHRIHRRYWKYVRIGHLLQDNELVSVKADATDEEA